MKHVSYLRPTDNRYRLIIIIRRRIRRIVNFLLLTCRYNSHKANYKDGQDRNVTRTQKYKQ
jgi:hypothetical protein